MLKEQLKIVLFLLIYKNIKAWNIQKYGYLMLFLFKMETILKKACFFT
jgi:hypothetical protein